MMWCLWFWLAAAVVVGFGWLLGMYLTYLERRRDNGCD